MLIHYQWQLIKDLKNKKNVCNFINPNEVDKLLKKHEEWINIFYIWTIYFSTEWTIKVFSSIIGA